MSRSAVICIVAVLALFLLPLSARANCTSPAGVEGQTVYNKDYHCFQYCNGVHWISFGTLAGGGGGGCTSPTGTEKQLVYNYAYHVLQYCNGTNWVAQGVVPGAAGITDVGGGARLGQRHLRQWQFVWWRTTARIV